ncbi:MAG: tetratricopeptide repeat protein [Alphaproteobacteria bacterium]|nr:MAG: tetratricopeptide repeat protein [Alphaproteobacteria bacterium]
MKSLLAPALVLAGIVGLNTLVPAPAQTPAPWAFDPSAATQNLCGPLGSKRGLLFRPELAHLLSSAAFADDGMNATVPLLKGLDSRKFTSSSPNPEAQAYFQQGFALLYGFNHWEAIRAFRKAQELDPECAICYWGEAVAHGPNINAPMDDAGNQAALAALGQALATKSHANAREAALIDALAVRYSADGGVARRDLDQAYADAMARVAADFPDDQDIATLYAEALMDTSPWDYWDRDFTTPRPHIRTALDAIESVLAKNPDHYGAIHLYIHLYEASTTAGKAAPYADRLAALAPGAGHLVHMPGHTYFRIGRYLDSLDTNIKAVAVDEDYLDATTGSTLYRYGYYPHNVHFVLVSAQMAGDAPTALEYAGKLDALVPMSVVAEAAWIAPIKAAPYFVYAQFAGLDTVMALPDPGDVNAYLKAMWHYARGVALAEAGDTGGAAAEKAAIDSLIDTDGIQNAGIPAATILKLAGETIAAKSLMKSGDYDAAIAHLKAAVAAQSSMPYTEPPFWYYSAEQTLGAALYEAGRFEEAEDAFKSSLIRHPNSAWSLYGLQQTLIRLNRMDEAAATELLLQKATRTPGAVSFIKL